MKKKKRKLTIDQRTEISITAKAGQGQKKKLEKYFENVELRQKNPELVFDPSAIVIDYDTMLPAFQDDIQPFEAVEGTRGMSRSSRG
ncbi:hypothetical protein LCGC14_1614850 [marine sediment metagenome]|uniref:Uncharacterized protein n=1 Tax=marine sediment metagenome TaxID=412755 RepID=A0A0F9KMS4_9ZZZZ